MYQQPYNRMCFTKLKPRNIPLNPLATTSATPTLHPHCPGDPNDPNDHQIQTLKFSLHKCHQNQYLK